MHIIECHFEFSGFDDRLVKAGTSVYLWNLARQFRDAGHRVGAVTPAHGLLPLLRERYEVVDLDWRTDDEIPVRLDPAEWPGRPETVRVPLSARAHRMTVAGVDIVLLSGGVLDTHPDSFYPPPRLKGRDLAFLKPLVFQVAAARYLGEQVTAGTVVHLHEPVHHYLLPALLAGRGFHVVSTVQTNLAVNTKVYGPGVRSVLGHEGADVSVAEGLADPPLDGHLERAMRAYLPRTLLHRDYAERPGHDYVPVLGLVARSVAALDFLSDGQLTHALSQAGTPFEQLFRQLTVRRELRKRTGLMTVGGCAVGDEWLDVRRSEERRKRTLDALALDPGLPTVYHNARYSVQHKGQKELFRGVRRLLDGGHRVNVLLHCLSPRPPEDEDLAALARDHADRVRVRTDPMDTPELQDWAAAADFCVFPSKFEMDTFLMAMGEAMAAGCVPLATAQQGMRHFGQTEDLDEPGATGLALPRSFRVDDEALTEAVRSGLLRLLTLWHTDPGRIEALRANAVAAGRSFTWKAAAERFLAVFAACAAGTRPADATPVVGRVLDADDARRPFPAGHGHAHRTGDTVRVEWRGEDLARVEIVPAEPEPAVVELAEAGGTFTGRVPYSPVLALLVTARGGRSSWHELAVATPGITATGSRPAHENRRPTVRKDTTLRPEPGSAPTPRASRHTEGVRAVLLAGGEGRRMGPLGQGRLKPLVPFGGTARLIDFSLANARRSGFRDVLLLSQYQERRLMDDLHTVWNRDPGFRVHFGPYDEVYRRSPGRLPGALPEHTRPRERGTADALIGKAEYVFEGDPSEVLVLHADHVYRFDYGDMIRRHRASGAALTVSYQRIERRYVHLFGMVEFDAPGQLTRFVEKPEHPTGDLVFAAFCVFDAAVLRRYLRRLAGTDWQHDISRDVIPAMLAGGERIRGHEVEGYWEDIGTVGRYHRSHRGLLRTSPTLPLADLPLTVQPRVPRHYVDEGPGVRASIVADGLVNGGLLDHCVAYPGVRIGAGATVRDSVLLPGARIPDGARLESVIVLEDGTVQRCDPEPAARGAA